MMQPADDELMQSVAGGDLRAFDELVLRHQKWAWNIAYRYLGDSAEAEDAVQEAFLRILQAAERYRPSGAFRSYLRRILVRLCIDTGRKMRPTYRSDPPEVESPGADPATRLADREAREQVRRELEALPSRQRMALVLRHYEGLAYAEIAESMDATPKAVERLLARGRDTLREALREIAGR